MSTVTGRRHQRQQHTAHVRTKPRNEQHKRHRPPLSCTGKENGTNLQGEPDADVLAFFVAVHYDGEAANRSPCVALYDERWVNTAPVAETISRSPAFVNGIPRLPPLLGEKPSACRNSLVLRFLSRLFLDDIVSATGLAGPKAKMVSAGFEGLVRLGRRWAILVRLVPGWRRAPGFLNPRRLLRNTLDTMLSHNLPKRSPHYQCPSK